MLIFGKSVKLSRRATARILLLLAGVLVFELYRRADLVEQVRMSMAAGAGLWVGVLVAACIGARRERQK